MAVLRSSYILGDLSGPTPVGPPAHHGAVRALALPACWPQTTIAPKAVTGCSGHASGRLLQFPSLNRAMLVMSLLRRTAEGAYCPCCYAWARNNLRPYSTTSRRLTACPATVARNSWRPDGRPRNDSSWPTAAVSAKTRTKRPLPRVLPVRRRRGGHRLAAL